MDPKKQIKEAVAESDKKILDNKKEIYDNLVEELFGKDSVAVRKKHLAKLIVPLSCAFAVICLAVCLVIFLPRTGGNQPPIYYFDNELFRDSTMDELTADLSEVNLRFNNSYEIKKVKLGYDSVSNDKLYYDVQIDNNERFEFININFIVNKYYEDTNEKVKEDYKQNIAGIEFTCEKKGLNELDSIFRIYATAQTGDQRIVITYGTYFDNYQEMFAEFVENTISLRDTSGTAQGN